MGCAFLVLTGCGDPGEIARRTGAAAAYLPFVPEAHDVWLSPDEATALNAWSVYREASRGSFYATDRDGALAYNGWMREDDRWPLAESVAGNLLTESRKTGLAALMDERAGEFAVVHVQADGKVVAATDLLGTQHLYYGERNGVLALSNRAFLVAAALDGGRLPTPNLMNLAWLMTGELAMFAGDTMFDDVRLLAGGCSLSADRSSLVVTRPPPDDERATSDDWDVHFAELCDRVAQMTRLPDVRFRQTLTGGKDSRLVLGAMLASGAIERLHDCWIEAEPGHPDAEIAQALADHYGLGLDMFKAHVADSPMWAQLDLHNFQTEVVFHAWDTKGSIERKREGVVNGHCGEIFRSHIPLMAKGGWPLMRYKYGSAMWVNRWGLLTKPAFERCRKRQLAEFDRWRDEGTPLTDMQDRWHRECRMQRWLGQALQHDGIGDLSFNPLPGAHLLRRYKQLPVIDRKGHRVHFELTRRVDDWLWRQPFESDTWSRHLLVGQPRPEPPLKRDFLQILPQFHQYKQIEAELPDFLLNPRDDGFFQIVDKRGVRRAMDRARRRPTIRRLQFVLGLVGLRAALQGIPVQPFRMAVGMPTEPRNLMEPARP